jgi:hypothetical protein
VGVVVGDGVVPFTVPVVLARCAPMQSGPRGPTMRDMWPMCGPLGTPRALQPGVSVRNCPAELGIQVGAGEGNRTLMTSLEGCDCHCQDQRLPRWQAGRLSRERPRLPASDRPIGHGGLAGSGGRTDVLLCSFRVGRVKPSANSIRIRVAPSPRPPVVTAGVRPELPSLALPGTS